MPAVFTLRCWPPLAHTSSAQPPIFTIERLTLAASKSFYYGTLLALCAPCVIARSTR